MADIKISDLAAAAALTGAEEVPVVQSSTTVKATAQAIANLAAGDSNIGDSDLTISSVSRKLTMSGALAANQFNVRNSADTKDILRVDGTGVVTFNEAYSLPIADGTEYQILQTDGAGAVTWEDQKDTMQFAATDLTTDFTVATFDIVVPIPYPFYVTEVRANVKTAPTGSDAIFDVKMNGTTMLSTLVTIDATELTSTTATTPAVISVPTLIDDNIITVNCTQIGSTIAGKGLTLTLNGYRIAPPPPFTNIYSLLFDGADDYLYGGSTLNIDTTNGLTLSMWLKNDTFLNTWNYPIVGGNGAETQLNLRVTSSGSLYSNYVGGSSSTGISGLADGNWHHIVMTINYSNGDVTFYKDSSVSATVLTFGSGYSTARFERIGNNVFANSGYAGNIDEVSIFKSVFSQTQVNDLYNSGTPTELTSLSPYLWFRMGDGDSYDIITDYGSAGFDMTMTNMTSGDIVTDVP